jgi:hypothetical protein
MPLSRLMYYSRICDGMGHVRRRSVVNDILLTSRANNPKNNITGALVEGDKFFIQLVEGSRPQLSELMKQIFNDDRHFDVRLLEYRRIEERQFAEFAMYHCLENNMFGRVIREQLFSEDGPDCILDPDAILKILLFSLKQDALGEVMQAAG